MDFEDRKSLGTTVTLLAGDPTKYLGVHAVGKELASEVLNFIRSYFENLRSKGTPVTCLEDQKLVVNGRDYRIRPDYACLLSGKVIVFELEASPRPIESIAKYWWLYEKTDWPNQGIQTYCYIILYGRALEEPIRAETVELLGKELQKKHNTFHFRLLKGLNIIEQLRKALDEDVRDPPYV